MDFLKFVFWLLLVTPALAQNGQNPIVGQTLPELPIATTPFDGSEILYVVQDGLPKQTPKGSFPSAGGTNTWTGQQTFSLNPIFSACTGYMFGNGASAATCVPGNTFPQLTITGNASGVLDLATAANTSIPIVPASGNAAAATAFNEKITASGSGNCTTGCSYNVLNVGGDTADVRTGGGAVQNAHALLVTQTAGGTGSGSTMHGNRGTLSSTFFLSSTSGNLPGDGASYSGGDIEATASVNDNGTAPTLGNYAGQIEALHVQGILKGTATAFGALQGAEIDVTAATGTSMYKKTALELTQLATDQVQGSTIDAALIIGNSVGAVGWNEGISFGGQSIWPMATGGTLIGCSQLNGCGTVASGIDFSTATFTTAALRLPGGMKVLGDGTTILAGPFHGSSTSAIPTCDAAHSGGLVQVSDGATSPTYRGSYSAAAGAVTVSVFCDGGGTWKYN